MLFLYLILNDNIQRKTEQLTNNQSKIIIEGTDRKVYTISVHRKGNTMKLKTIIITLLVLLLTGIFVCAASAEAVADDTLSLTVTATVSGQTINTFIKDGVNYLFLPSNAELSKLDLTITTAAEKVVVYDTETGSYGTEIADGATDITAVAAVTDGVYSVTLRGVSCDEENNIGAYSEYKLAVMKSENISAMFITTADKNYGRQWVDSSPNHSNDAGKKTDVSLYMTDGNGKKIYDGALTSWKGRGNSTWGTSAKKPYQIKLDKKTDLLKTGDDSNKGKTWILLANALDRTLIKNALAFDLAAYLGCTETPQYTFVDLYTDGEYRGNYVLCEKVQINKGRVDINDLEAVNKVEDESATAQSTNKYGCQLQYNPTASVPEGTDISGGYIIEMDSAFYAAENSWFKVRVGSYYYMFVVKSPEYATKEQVEYISEYMFEALHALRDDVCSYTKAGVEELVDVNSVGAMYALNEYTSNIDYTASSTYFFLPENGNENYAHKLYAGPAWDFDTSLGNRTDGNYYYKWMRDPNYFDRWRKNPMYLGSIVKKAMSENGRKLSEIGDILFSSTPVYDETTGVKSVTYYTDLIDGSQRMNYTKWAFEDTANTFCYPTYEENVKYATDFLKTRHEVILPQVIALAPAAPAYTPGDVDGDGEISVSDARLALRAAVGLPNEGIDTASAASAAFLAADADKDEKITVTDARMILRAAIKIEALEK